MIGSFTSCNFFGLDQELKDFTIQHLELSSNLTYPYLTPPDVWVESRPFTSNSTFTNTRDSVFRKLQVEYSEIKKVDFYRIELSTSFPTDSSLVIIDSIHVYLANTKNLQCKIGTLDDIPINTTLKTMNLNLYSNSDSAGLIMQADTTFFKSYIYLRSAIVSDSMVFNVKGEYNISGQ